MIHKTIDMPFLNRHSPDEIRKNPDLRTQDFENTKTAAKKFTRYPTTAFSFAEGTRFTDEKRILQSSPFESLLKPKTGALMTALSGMPMVEELIDFTIIYKTSKRSAWNFACGEMNEIKVIVKCYEIPKSIRSILIMQKILLQIIISISLLLSSYSTLNAEEKNYKIS